METERLQKIIAHAGFASRREAETMIREGRVTVNGRVVKELGSKATPGVDHVKVDGKLITKAEDHRYFLLYKPKEVMTTVEDPQGRRTVLDLIKGVRERIYPVGRLDYHSEGLILLTNDGDLAFKVSHPTQGSVKTYHVKVRGVPEERLVEKLERGITIDGKRTLPCEMARLKTTGRNDEEGNSWFEVKLREGRTQQIRKMFQAVGHPVSKLRRVAIGPLSDPRLGPGDYRELTRAEVKMLATGHEPAKPKEKPRRAAAARSVSKKKTAPSTTKTAAARKTPRKAAAPAKRRASADPVKRRTASAPGKRGASAAPAKRRTSTGASTRRTTTAPATRRGASPPAKREARRGRA